MKTIKDDWHFVAGENQSKLPPIQENRIFHALTAAYQNSHHQDLFKTTQMIVKKEKELCETALSELGKVGEDTGGPSDTLNLLMDHYNSRLILAVNKEKVIDKLAEDSQQMLEEYKGKTHELAEVKRTLMESQSKLRELSKVTEKLTKKEEELRFIESNLRQGIESNKRDILNGLYEIVLEIGESSPLPIEVPSHIEALPAKNISVEKSPENLLAKLESPKQALTAAPKPTEAKTDSNTNVKPETIKATQVATPKASDLKSPLKSPFPIPERAESKQVAPAPPSEMRIPASLSGLAQLVSNSKLNAEKNEIEEVRVFEEKKKEGKPTFAPIPTANVPPLLINPVNQDTAEFSVPQMHGFQNQQSESIAFESADPMYLLQVAESQRFFEPDREACSKSLVKTPDGAVIAEYFYLTQSYKNERHYVFNTLHTVLSLLSLRKKSVEEFHIRMELLFGDLLNRLESTNTIHLETHLNEICNKKLIENIMRAPRKEKQELFDSFSRRALAKMEAMGKNRAELLLGQLEAVSSVSSTRKIKEVK